MSVWIWRLSRIWLLKTRARPWSDPNASLNLFEFKNICSKKLSWVPSFDWFLSWLNCDFCLQKRKKRLKSLFCHLWKMRFVVWANMRCLTLNVMNFWRPHVSLQVTKLRFYSFSSAFESTDLRRLDAATILLSFAFSTKWGTNWYKFRRWLSERMPSMTKAVSLNL